MGPPRSRDLHGKRTGTVEHGLDVPDGENLRVREEELLQLGFVELLVVISSPAERRDLTLPYDEGGPKLSLSHFLSLRSAVNGRLARFRFDPVPACSRRDGSHRSSPFCALPVTRYISSA